MTVYLRGKDRRPDQIEKGVQSVSVDGKYINIKYKPDTKRTTQWVVGVTYLADEMEIERVEA